MINIFYNEQMYILPKAVTVVQYENNLQFITEYKHDKIEFLANAENKNSTTT